MAAKARFVSEILPSYTRQPLERGVREAVEPLLRFAQLYIAPPAELRHLVEGGSHRTELVRGVYSILCSRSPSPIFRAPSASLATERRMPRLMK
jgi:hypothetical protein